MRVFVTGATGFIGSAVVQELLRAGHAVLGLARSDAAASALAAAGAEVHRGALDDADSLTRGAAAADGVIHTAFIHDFSSAAAYAACAATDGRAIETLGAALAGSQRPLVVSAGTALVATGGVVTENDAAPDPSSAVVPRVSEHTALALAPRGVRVSVMRLPPSVHGEGDHGFVPALIGLARDKRVAAYVGDGLNRWPAVHRLDAARLYRLALEKAPAGGRLHAVADEGVAMREIAAVIGKHLGIPVVAKTAEEAAGHFGWIAHFAAMDRPASSALTQERLGWRPTQPALLPDLDRGHYFATRA